MSLENHKMNKRVHTLFPGTENSGPVVYWMSRDQRVRDNWALLHAQRLAMERKRPLGVVFSLVTDYPGATWRHYAFMLKGLCEVESELKKKSIPFFLLQGETAETIPGFARKYHPALLVTDFDPLRIKRRWKDKISNELLIPMIEVDAHNIVPCRAASDKQEWAAYTLRPKIRKALDTYLIEFPKLKKHPHVWPKMPAPVSWEKIAQWIKTDRSVVEPKWIKPGEKAALKALRTFVSSGLTGYDRARNDPTRDGQSGLSPWLHFGQLSPQRVALMVMGSHCPKSDREAFTEELIVRRELSDNFCLYNDHYDSMEGFPEWARTTLRVHTRDRREHVYTPEEFECSGTHDPLWNAAQMEMVRTGKMHGFMRMYWAKKILEWSPSPEDAMKTAIYLNDRYSLDGRDPNGYTGIAWSIGGVHDRAWNERPVFGKVRYMSYDGCRRKFNLDDYIKAHASP